MCGISGWVAYDRDLREEGERSVVAAMTATMRCRGPDASGVWTSAHAALGHRRLAVIDLAGGRQPMTVEVNEAIRAVITYSGEVYNYRQLRTELEGLGHRFSTSSDTEVVLRAYLEWGDGFPARLNGMYACALWNPARDELLLVRDRLGIKPLYYALTSAGTLFGSEPKALLTHPTVDPVVDADGLREMLSLFKTPGHAVYAGLREVRPGHTVRVRRDGVTEHCYWRLEARAHTDSLTDTVSTVRNLLEDIVTRQLIADVPVCALLSGGLDSSTITALAAGQPRAPGQAPLRSFAVGFAGAFVADEDRSTPDGPFARALAESVTTEHTEILLDPVDLMDPRHRQAVLRAYDLPTAFGDLDVSLLALFAAISQRSTVALSGEAADEVFGGYRWFHDQRALAADTFPWLAHEAPPTPEATDWESVSLASDMLDPSLLDPALLTALDLPGYRQARYREALADVPHLPDDSSDERRMREVCHLSLTRLLPLLLDRKDRLSMATGLEVRVPFCDHRLVQYIFNTPWAMKTFDGREKSLLRAAARDLLPDVITDRPKSPYPRIQNPSYGEALRDALASVLDDPAAPVHSLVDASVVRRRISGAGAAERVRHGAEVVLALDTWLRAYGAELKI